ncbi:hypothetical protein ACWV2X_36910 [Streptomyces hydrogenans]
MVVEEVPDLAGPRRDEAGAGEGDGEVQQAVVVPGGVPAGDAAGRALVLEVPAEAEDLVADLVEALCAGGEGVAEGAARGAAEEGDLGAGRVRAGERDEVGAGDAVGGAVVAARWPRRLDRDDVAAGAEDADGLEAPGSVGGLDVEGAERGRALDDGLGDGPGQPPARFAAAEFVPGAGVGAGSP